MPREGLTDDLLRQIAEEPDPWFGLTDEDVRALARRVLQLEAKLAEAVAIAREAVKYASDGDTYWHQEEVAALAARLAKVGGEDAA